jgi:glycosyltransferase involved in cell wall biosynthesis
MALGRPVLATGRGGSGEYLVGEQNALLFAPGDAGALATAVRRLAGDSRLRARLTEAGLETASRHSADVFNQRVLELIEQTAGRSPS